MDEIFEDEEPWIEEAITWLIYGIIWEFFD